MNIRVASTANDGLNPPLEIGTEIRYQGETWEIYVAVWTHVGWKYGLWDGNKQVLYGLTEGILLADYVLDESKKADKPLFGRGEKVRFGGREWDVYDRWHEDSGWKYFLLAGPNESDKRRGVSEEQLEAI